jgi:hypothetical protein
VPGGARRGGDPPELGLRGRHIFDDDQAAWSDLYIRGEADIILDGRSEIFQSLARVDHRIGTANREIAFEGRRVVNRETGSRPCLLHGNGGVPMEPWARYVLEPPVLWAWPLVARIRSEPLPALRDRGHVERLLLDLGLHEPVDDDVPVHLLPYSGKGLAIRRRPSEYATLLAWLASRPADPLVRRGRRRQRRCVHRDRRVPPALPAARPGPGRRPRLPAVLLDYVSRARTAHHVRGSRAADGLRGIAMRGGHVDLVLIDAHRPDGDARADWRSPDRAAATSRSTASRPPTRRRPHCSGGQIRSAHRMTREFVDRRLPSGSCVGLGVVDLAYGDA